MAKPDEFPLKCSKCGEKLNFDELAYAIFKYGEIILQGETQCYFGYNCVKCDKPTTNLHQFQIDDWNDIAPKINAAFSKYEIPFIYRSFPYNYHSYANPKPIGPFPTPVDTEFCTVSEAEIEAFENNSKIDRKDVVRSYSILSSAMGPAVAIWWYRHEDIQRFVDFENNKGLKIFPRLIAYDPIYTDIDNLCWRACLETEHYNSLHVTRISESGESISIPLTDAIPFTDILLSTPKKEITKIVDFLHIIDTIHREDTSQYQKSNISQMIGYTSRPSKLPRQSIKANESNEAKAVTGARHEQLSKHIWKKFNDNHVQEIISWHADKFIEEYIALSKKVGATYDAVWNLKEKYLYEVYEAIQTDYKKRKSIKKKSEELASKVIEIENEFPAFKNIISINKEINQIKTDLYNWATLPGNLITDILIQGETGTGKELFAKAFHQATTGSREDNLIAVNCSAISPKLFESEFFGYKKGSHGEADKDQMGYFQQADGGILFLDEIGDIAPEHQAKLLRVIENREIQPVGGIPKKVDVKVIFATERNLDQMVLKNEFRESLLARFNDFSVYLPPLRNRPRDIEPLSRHFIELFAKETERPELADISIENEALEVLKKYPWKRNVRELRGVIKKIIANRVSLNNTDDISTSDLPDRILEEIKPPIPGTKKNKSLPGDDEFYKLVEIDKVPMAEIARMYDYTRPYISKVYHERIKPKFEQNDS